MRIQDHLLLPCRECVVQIQSTVCLCGSHGNVTNSLFYSGPESVSDGHLQPKLSNFFEFSVNIFDIRFEFSVNIFRYSLWFHLIGRAMRAGSAVKSLAS